MTSLLSSQKCLEGWSPQHARETILDQHNPPTHTIHFPNSVSSAQIPSPVEPAWSHFHPHKCQPHGKWRRCDDNQSIKSLEKSMVPVARSDIKTQWCMDTSLPSSQRCLEDCWSPLHARESILDQHNPTTHMIYHLQQFCHIKFTEPIFIPHVVGHVRLRLRNYWSMPSPTLQGGKGRDGRRERERQGENEARKEGREADPNRNQVGISNYSTSTGSWMHGRNRSTISLNPSPGHTAPHFTFISPSSSCCCLSL